LAPADPVNTAPAVTSRGRRTQDFVVGLRATTSCRSSRSRRFDDRVAQSLRVDGYEPTVDAVNDAFQAIRLVRSHAAEWKLVREIGMIGFSPSRTSAPTVFFFDEFAREECAASDPLPGFPGRFRGWLSGRRIHESSETDPRKRSARAHRLCGSGDQVNAVWATEYFTPMLKACAQSEMHITAAAATAAPPARRGGSVWHLGRIASLEWFATSLLERPAPNQAAAKSPLTQATRKPLAILVIRISKVRYLTLGREASEDRAASGWAASGVLDLVLGRDGFGEGARHGGVRLCSYPERRSRRAWCDIS